MDSSQRDDSHLSELIAHLYDAAIDETLWPGTATCIAKHFGSISTVVKLHDDTQVNLLECTDNLMVSEREASWAETWHRDDLWVQRSVAYGMSRVITDEDLVTPEEQAASGFYQEWLHHLGIYHMVGAVFPGVGNKIGVLGIHRPREGGAYTPGERRKVALILPHLQRALNLRQRLAAMRQTHAATLQALDRLDTGVLMVDRYCLIMQASAMAETLLRENREISTTAGRLLLAQPPLHDKLRAMVGAAIDTARGKATPLGSALSIPRAGRLPLAIEVTPLRPLASPVSQQPAALIFIRDPEMPIATGSLRELFGFTRTEAAVATLLAQGNSLDEIAIKICSGPATVRSHLKQIFAKTGTHRQAELVALVARSVSSVGK
jgi:DNA-binding CsgD family transcriptional regulator